MWATTIQSFSYSTEELIFSPFLFNNCIVNYAIGRCKVVNLLQFRLMKWEVCLYFGQCKFTLYDELMI